MIPWYSITNVAEVHTPALLVYPDRVEENIRRMLTICGSPDRLRPHIKTHKLAEVIQLQQTAGILKFKCATIAECEMVASCGAKEILLAYQPVGPNIARLSELMRKFPATLFSTMVDSLAVAQSLSDHFRSQPAPVEVLLDLDLGMLRCGIAPGPESLELYRYLGIAPGLKPGGLHVYDGHVHMTDLAERTIMADEIYARASRFRDQLLALNLPVPRLVIGGTPTFPIHARRTDTECSPGTCLFWDWGYSTKFPDMEFLHAALILTRIISKPASNRICLDLGHKAIASENPHPRVHFPDLPEAIPVMHSEEHLVLETSGGSELNIGTVLYGIPRHVCPTVALHQKAVIVHDHVASGQWDIAARARALTV